MHAVIPMNRMLRFANVRRGATPVIGMPPGVVCGRLDRGQGKSRSRRCDRARSPVWLEIAACGGGGNAAAYVRRSDTQRASTCRRSACASCTTIGHPSVEAELVQLAVE